MVRTVIRTKYDCQRQTPGVFVQEQCVHVVKVCDTDNELSKPHKTVNLDAMLMNVISLSGSVWVCRSITQPSMLSLMY